jgi:hypothetical protein
MRPLKYGDEVTAYATIGDLDDCKITGSWHPETGHDGIDIRDPDGDEISWSTLTWDQCDAIEQAIVDCYSCRPGGEPDDAFTQAVDRGLYHRKARLEDGQ